MAASNKSLNRQKGYTVEFVVDWLRTHDHDISLASREFGIDRKRIREWDHYLKQHNHGTLAKKRRLGGGRCPLSKELDEKVFEFLEEHRSNGLAVSNISSEIAGGLRLQGFKCTSGWLHRWKGRYNVGYRRGTNVSQKVPADYADQILQVRKDIISLRTRLSHHTYTTWTKPCAALICPGTVSTWRKDYSNQNYPCREERVHSCNCIIMFLHSLYSYNAIPSYYTCFKHLRCISLFHFIIMQVRATAWGPQQMAGWHERSITTGCNVWLWTATRALRLLRGDNYNSNVIVIPGGFTSIIQPMDKCINKPFKTYMRQEWE